MSADSTPEKTATATAGEAGWLAQAEMDAGDDVDQLHVDITGYEGPLDLLLALARTRKVDLAHISMLELADQYLAHIAETQNLRLEVAAEYLVMAAWLAFLKSKLLLPKEKLEADEPSGEELAAKLAFRLMRLEAMRKVAAQLMTRKRLGIDVFGRGMPEGVKTIRERQYTAQIYDLLKAYTVQRGKAAKHTAHVVKARKVWSIKDARRQLERLVGQSAGDWVQLDLFLHQYMPSPELGRTAMASSLGASLEMAREGVVELWQERPFSPLYMRRKAPEANWVEVE